MMLQGPIPPHAPQGSPLAAAIVVLLAVLALGAVHLMTVIRRADEADLEELLKKWRRRDG